MPRGRSAVSTHSHASHHYHGHAFRQALLVPRLLTPAQAAHGEATALYRAYYTPSGSCCPTSLPYLGGVLTFASLILTLASLCVPWYYFGGSQPVSQPGTGRSGLWWGASASLNSMSYCTSSTSLSSSSLDAGYWFARNCRSALSLGSLGFSDAPFAACLVLCSLALPLHLLALLHPVLACSCCPCGARSGGGDSAADACACASPCRPSPGPELRAAHAAVLGLKLAPAALGLVGALTALYGLPADALHRALGSPIPGAQDAPGAVLARVAVVLAWGAVALELGFSGAVAAHVARAGQGAGRPLPPPPAPPAPTALEARALAQGAGMVSAGLLHLLQPAPVLPEDLRAFGVQPLREAAAAAPAAAPGAAAAAAAAAQQQQQQVELYYCRVRLYQGAALKEDAAGGSGGYGGGGGAQGAGGEEVVPLVLALGSSAGVRVRVRLGEDGSALPQLLPPAAQLAQFTQLLQLAGGGGSSGRTPFGQPPTPAGGQLVVGGAGAAGAGRAVAAPHFCSACGAGLAGGARFCSQCGAGVMV
jgi:hypothetical protein